MSRTDAQFKIRLPAAMLGQLQAEASANMRTCSAEIVYRLATTLPALAPLDVSDEAAKARAVAMLDDPSGRDFCERMARVLNEQRRATGNIDVRGALFSLGRERSEGSR